MSLSIGPYRVSRELGKGGMGVVYLATDSRLDRPVAVKALPETLAADPDRLARFQREARILASLNHPSIAAIHGLEEHEGRLHLVLEYVEGHSLADRIKDGPFPLEEALPIARQIAEALEAAHEKGIVHRDLKPANVMLRTDGAVKVLDFGLARAASDAPISSTGHGSTHAPTLTTPAPLHSPTIPGAIMGTAGYMSPEQARGKPVDKRSDIFSFGCILFEMLSGAQPFVGETPTDSIGAILHKDPEWGLLPPATPTVVAHLLRRCLTKDRHRRLHDIADARLDLEQAIADPAGSESGPHRTVPSASPLRAPILTLAALALLGAGWYVARATAPHPPRPERTVLTIPPESSAYRRAGGSVISPDGRSIVFSALSMETNKWGLWYRSFDSFDSRPIPESDDAEDYFWSPDARSIAFHNDGKLWSIDVPQGGSRRLLAAEPGNTGANWGPRGDILLSRAPGKPEVIRIIPGGATEQLTTLDDSKSEKIHAFPTFLPDGERFLFLAVSFDPSQEVRVGKLYAGRVGSTDRTFVTNLLSAVSYVEPGWLIYVEDGTVKALPFDQAALKVTGPPVTLCDGAYYFKGYGATSLHVAATGALNFEPPGGEDELAWFDAAGARLGTIGPRAGYDRPRISPDGSQAAVGLADRRTGMTDLWLYGLNRSTSTRLTTDARWEGGPSWSRDGSTIYFSSDKSDAPWVYSMRADGSGPLEDIYGKDSGGSVWMCEDVSPDGASLLVSGTVEKLGRELRVVPLKGNGPAVPFRSTPATERQGRFSPDGKWIAYVSDESGAYEVYLAPYPGPGQKVQVSERGGTYPSWSPAGDRIYFLRSTGQADPSAGASDAVAELRAVDLATPEAFKSPPPPRTLFHSTRGIGGFDVAPDGKRFLVHLVAPNNPPIHVVLNSLPQRP